MFARCLSGSRGQAGGNYQPAGDHLGDHQAARAGQRCSRLGRLAAAPRAVRATSQRIPLVRRALYWNDQVVPGVADRHRDEPTGMVATTELGV